MMNLKLLAFSVLWFPLALASDHAPLGTYTARERSHWVFVKRATPAVPTFAAGTDKAWGKTPIDAFILVRMQKEGLQPSAPADRVMLIRRLYFDLIGLPPSPQAVEAFVKDKAPDAYQKLVEKLLASPQYGERWGQHWLDVVRFAETDGFEYDTHRNDAWRYRDYIIKSFNEDKPYNRFVMEQLAGDELDATNDELLVASGFNRLGPLRKNAGNQEVASSRNEVLTEMTNVVGSAFLGVTIGCARCHNHKFDPVRQSDYYRIQAYFAGVYDKDIPKASAEEQAARKAKADPIEKEITKVNSEILKLNGKTDAASMEQQAELKKKLEALQDQLPPPLPALHSVTDMPEKKSPIHLLTRGEYDKKGQRVGMRPLGVLLEDGTPELPENTAKPRVELAKWIVDPNNPLTARVMVNRIWQYHFGRGIVATTNDFGRMGARPTHPELLDYLANEFVAHNFSVKHIHRLILNSNTYQQTSAPPTDPELRALVNKKDPENKFYSHFNRQRLSAEQIRDAMLAVAGTLNLKQSGPSVMVPIDPELVNLLYKPSQWVPAKDAREYLRRSIYLIAKRNLRLPMMEVFDAPDLQASCARRESSTHAPQALELMNGSFANQQADAFAKRLETEAGPNLRKQIDLGYRLVTGRAAKPKEMQVALEFLKTQPKREFALTLLNLNAFLYVN
ncbi:MAG TPA: DUF1549 and DUF1553 domain-containing protein [Blastocatellia bacterium]|nr:DUF1549 and DUF1553 domain-containing protein [Blastocatellia bacterium]